MGREVEPQNTHIVLFKSPRNVIQLIALSAHMGRGTELVELYRDANFFPFDHLLIDMSPRTDDRVRYCTTPDPSPRCQNPGQSETIKTFG